MDQKLGPRKGFNMGLQIWHPKDGPDLTPQKMVQIWPPNEGPDLAPKIYPKTFQNQPKISPTTTVVKKTRTSAKSRLANTKRSEVEREKRNEARGLLTGEPEERKGADILQRNRSGGISDGERELLHECSVGSPRLPKFLFSFRLTITIPDGGRRRAVRLHGAPLGRRRRADVNVRQRTRFALPTFRCHCGRGSG